MHGLDVSPLTVGLSARSNHLGPAHYLLSVSIGGWQWVVGHYCLFPYDIFSDSLPLTPRVACALTTNTRTEMTCTLYRSSSIIRMIPSMEPPHAFPKRTTNYDIHNSVGCTECFKKSFTHLKARINLFRGQVQCFELSWYSETHRVLPEIVAVECDFHWKCRVFQKKLWNFPGLNKFIQRICTVFWTVMI
jgi:hypothetical protein